MSTIRSYKYYIQIGVFVVISIVSFIAIDSLIRFNMDTFDTIALKNSSEKDITNLKSEIRHLDDKFKQLQVTAENLQSSTYPTLNDIKNLSKKYNLSISKVNKSKELDNNKILYTISISGNVYNVLYFLRSFESSFIVDADAMTIYPVDINGDILNLQISIILEM